MKTLTTQEIQQVSGAGFLQDALTKGGSLLGGLAGTGIGLIPGLGVIAPITNKIGSVVGDIIGNASGALIEGFFDGLRKKGK